jgi:hypothetical protein
VGLARRLVKRWPDLDEQEQADVLAVLIGGLPLRPYGRTPGGYNYDQDPRLAGGGLRRRR